MTRVRIEQLLTHVYPRVVDPAACYNLVVASSKSRCQVNGRERLLLVLATHVQKAYIIWHVHLTSMYTKDKNKRFMITRLQERKH